MKENAISRFKELIIETQKYKKLKLIGYITTPLIVGFFILKKVNPKLVLLNNDRENIIHDLESSVKNKINQLEKDYIDLKESDTYLIYSEKNENIHLINELIEDLDFIIKQNILPDNLRKLSTQTCEKATGLLTEINKYNEEFVKRKKKEYVDLFKRENLILDDDQQTAIVTDDKHNLVVAGAGSGKTEVLITRIAYLVKRKSDTIKPEKILALAFQRKAAEEIQKRLKDRYNIESVVPKDIGLTEFSKVGCVTIGTFHSLGNKIIHDCFGKNAPKLKPECSDEWNYPRYIQRLFDEELKNNSYLKDVIISFMKLYGDKEIIKTQDDFLKKEDFYQYMNNLHYTCLDGETVRSEAERVIKNFFIMHTLNGEKIKIEYEVPAKWMKYVDKNGVEQIPRPDFFFPDFDIHIEHWTISDNDNEKVPDWFGGENPTERYLESMRAKKKKFADQDKYVLIETTEAEYRKSYSGFEEKLKKKFIDVLKNKYPDKDFQLTPLSYEALKEIVWAECKGAVKSLPENISKYIRIAKTYSLEPEDIKTRLVKEKWSLKQKLFAEIAIIVYKRYREELTKEHVIDFQDMINLAIKSLKENPKLYENTYDHILIDEYQDISTQRYELIKELMNKNQKCKLFCVGDDWQSIMGFAGSNLDFFINFEKYFPHPKRTDLTKNYRSIKSIVDAGACIIKHNSDGQIKKKTISNSDKLKPLLLYSVHEKAFVNKYNEKIAKHCLDKIKEYHEKDKNNYPYHEFMVLMRIANKNKLIWKYIDFYANELRIKPIMNESHVSIPNTVRFMSVHKSKGMQAKVVFILNLDRGLYGFPCELENPDIFETAIQNNDGFREHEERRLFYVAVTRAKEEVIMYTQKCSESKFITEIKDFITREDLPY